MQSRNRDMIDRAHWNGKRGRRIETEILIVGAGPVGLALALDLAWRGVNVTIAELRAGQPPSVKCNQISARSMEFFRRLGIAMVSATTVTGIELSRVAIPSRAQRGTATNGPDTWWPTPETSRQPNLF